jgi:hypothetical protein
LSGLYAHGQCDREQQGGCNEEAHGFLDFLTLDLMPVLAGCLKVTSRALLFRSNGRAALTRFRVDFR